MITHGTKRDKNKMDNEFLQGSGRVAFALIVISLIVTSIIHGAL